MLKATITVEQISQEIVNFLSQFIKVDRLILFGSYVYGIPKKESDFDIAVISEDLKDMNILEKIELFSQVALNIDSRIELKGYTKSEFLHPEKGSMLAVIKQCGKIIYA